ncbi:hypothetical protein [Halostella salina]|uniref:hypothetical protein n=1 Tax=Halostella salina TaxID=1547897 RepID=UPI0013CF0AA0|nr:hypothetical protein [Halostella salina]
MVADETLLRISTVLVSLTVVSAPILYPKYSLFTRRAVTGVKQLREVREEYEDVDLTYIEQGETGFKQLVEAAGVAFGYSGDPERICLAVGRPRDLGEFTGFGMKHGIGDNGVLYIEEKGDEDELLRWEPWSPTSTLELEKLSRGVQLRARERSHTITVSLAVLWATLSIVTVV